MHPNPRRVLPVILILALAGLGYWYFFGGGRATSAIGALSASGTIESIQVDIVPEFGGRVKAVNVQEGDHVRAGDVLIQFDTTLLEAQRAQAEAAVAVAQAALGAAQAALGPAQAAETTASAGLNAAQAQYDQVKNGARPEQIAVVEAQIKTANALVGQAVAQRDQIAEGATADKIAAAQAQLTQALLRQKEAQDAYEILNERIQGWMREQAALRVNAANEAVVAAQAALDQILAGASAETLRAYSNAIGVAAGQRDQAKAQLALLKAGATQEQLDAAQAQVDAAQGQVKAAQAQVDVVQAQIKAAQAQVQAAQAALKVLDVQIAKLTLTAPADGVVLSRAIEPGEVASPSATLLVVGQLDDLTITVYVPEDRYGSISLGQAAQVSVDSFPGQTFTASVRRIADQAEFTPRNVQTADGRKTTVFAVKLSVDNTAGQLKPGMPADVRFSD